MKYLALLLVLLPLPALAADTAAGTWGVFGRVLADVLQAADTAAARDTDLARFCTLLEQLEEQTTYGAQRRGWSSERLEWGHALRRATTVAAAGKLLLDYDGSLRDEALTANGLAERAAWRERVGKAATVPALAELLRARAWTLARDAMHDTWERERNAWLAEASALAGEYAAAVTPAAAAGVVAPDRTTPGELLRQLEAALKREMLAKSWRNRRAAWLAATRQPLTGATVRQLGEACLPAAFAGEWDAAGWRARTRDAADTAAVLALLRELENELAWEATGTEWPTRRESWLQELEAWLAPEAANTPAVVVQAATETSVRVALLQLDQALRVSAQRDEWFARRTAWAGTLATADARGLAQGLTVFADGLQATSFTLAWTERRAGWQAATATADSVAAVAALLAELETYLDPSALVATWPQDRAQWRGTLGFGAGGVPVLAAAATAAVTPAPSDDTPAAAAAPAVAAAPTAEECATLMACARELEQRIKLSAQTGEWTNQRRTQWLADNRVARDTASVQRQLLALEGSLRDGALRDPGWRSAWRARMPAATGAAALAAQLRALEAALAPGTTDPSWQARRASWLAKLAALEQNG